MKDALILLLLILVVCATVFLGATALLKKTIQSTPKVERDPEYKEMMQAQRQRMDDIQQRQRQSMRDTQQRIRDLKRLNN